MRSGVARRESKQRRKDEEIAFARLWHSTAKDDGTAPQLNGTRYFSFKELKKYTNNFSKDNEIGEGSFGKVYKGCCPDGVAVAVKESSKTSRKEFQIEIEVLSRIHHKNIQKFLGFCFEQEKKLIVYEYITKGNLRDNIDGICGIHLGWKKRLQIALDSARGLAYLHELANPLIIHRDIKSINIALDENLNARVIGFDVPKLVSEKQKENASSQDKRTLTRVKSAVKGTIGYLDPEYFQTQQLSEKSDVYSFGMVMLELITGRSLFDIHAELNKAIGQNDEGPFLFEKVHASIDQNDLEYYGLRNIIDPKIVTEVRNDEFRKFLQLALKCLKHSASDRPSMSEIMRDVDIILQHDGSERTTITDYLDDFGNATYLPQHPNRSSRN
ncbi:Leucine-rich repeat protein kinase family protein [Rhynchospora pubera]|uniref:Leucine-rich repeat protein kinase family protein n=1 Tax=Rhynchospora pubera TaxID=906938 RepID=A0AAV8HYP9_9POAL|nr:Leucine-rich repeat protein kinase family protein [Rhynchospora pubera]